jgi:hypothetical protein
MNNKDKSGDLIIGIILLVCFAIYFIIDEPFLLSLLIPISIILFLIYDSGTNKRDTYFKSKRVLLGTVALVGFMTILFFYMFNSDFEVFGYERDFYVNLGVFLVFVSAFFAWFSKQVIPISFIEDDDRLVQETMYEDYDFQTLGEVYAYRGITFKDETGNSFTIKDLHKAKGKITSSELVTNDLEMVALNDKEHLKFYYEKLIYDFYKVLSDNSRKLTNEHLLKLYGYNFTFIKRVKSEDELKKLLKKESLLYSKIYHFLEKDMKNPEINISLNIENICKDNLYCLELILISAILMVRQYMNFPVGDLMKYVKTKKDKNFIGCFSSLPADYSNVNSTSASASGIAYYFIYYKLHLIWFTSNTDREIIKRWVRIKD